MPLPTDSAPILRAKDYAASSVFQPENLLREARRQKDLAPGDLPAVCLLDPDGDLGKLPAGGAIKLHVTACHRGIELGRRDGAGRHLELADHVELRHLRHPRPDAAAGIAGAAE